VKIYYKVVGNGPPLLLHHGFCLDHNDYSNPNWDFVKAFQEDFTLILMDARGHGASDKPHDPQEYRLLKQVSDVIAVLDDLQIEKVHFLGYSMGGGIGFGLACNAQERFNSFVLGGASPEDAPTDEPSPLIPIFQQGPQAVIGLMEQMMQGPLPPSWKDTLQANDYEALIAALEMNENCGMEAMLPSVKVPCLIFVGEEDPLMLEQSVRAT
jgi:pimeloyl-ACP methyl ester carboxylesterase